MHEKVKRYEQAATCTRADHDNPEWTDEAVARAAPFQALPGSLRSKFELLQLDNVITTPHSAALTDEAMRKMGCDAAEDLLRVLRGERPKACANPQVLAG
ncbi:MAG: hypothetical protein U1F17_12695 [Burkholderiaceae bacterium]